MYRENVLTKTPSENILKLRELTDRMTREEGDRKSFKDAIDEISKILNLEPKHGGESEKIRFYEKICSQIKKVLNSIK